MFSIIFNKKYFPVYRAYIVTEQKQNPKPRHDYIYTLQKLYTKKPLKLCKKLGDIFSRNLFPCFENLT